MPRQRKRRAKVNYDAIIEQTMQLENKRAVGYCRVSTKEQVAKNGEEKMSLEHQKDAIIRWTVYKGYDLVDMYMEKGESGAKEDRTELTRLLKDAEEGKFDVVVVYTPDRFSRKVRIAMETYYKLKDLGIGIVILNPEIDTRTVVGEMMFNLLSYFAEMDREDIRKKTKLGREYTVQKGKYISKKPYGYKVVDGQLEIIPEEAEVVKRIFHWKAFDKKMSLRKIAEQLNQEGIPSPTGKKWSYVTVHKILKNELYCGKYIYTIDGKPTQIDMDYEPIVAPQVWGRANAN